MARTHEVVDAVTLEPMITPRGDAAILGMYNSPGNYVDLTFRTKEALVRMIATLISMQQEWDRHGKEVEEFHAERADA